ncbi:MAG: alkaline phosphatase D family protein [Steroidobacteraceae bacterium]
MPNQRRDVLKALAALGGGAALPGVLAAAPAERAIADYPFRLGVSSGFPTHRSVVLWTRLAPQPDQPDGGLPPQDWSLRYEVAADQGFRQIVARGRAIASARHGHSVHLTVPGLRPARDYWYRFMLGAHASAAGRTRTLPDPQAQVDALRLVVASCQHYEQAQYAAWRHAAADAPDLILFLGDYIYESVSRMSQVRRHSGGVPRTVAEFRQRYALYQLDPALQAAHAAAPWLVMWDDHEVQNDYAGVHPGQQEDPATFLAMRAAAYQSWFEHMPVPATMAPVNGAMPVFARHHIGRLATLHVLDQRQYRSAEACGRPPTMGGNQVGDDCAERLEPARTMLGAVQEQWLARGLRGSAARWTLLGQGTPFSYTDQKAGAEHSYWTDSWSGYPAARQRFVDLLQQARCPNPVILSGDIHAYIMANINAVPERPETPVVACELAGTSISSDSLAQPILDVWKAENPCVQLFEGRSRGYLSLTLSERQLQVDLVTVADSTRADSPRGSGGSFVVEAGIPGVQRA